MNKKLIGLLLALCLVIGLLPAMAMADGDDLAQTYTLKFGFNSYELKKYDTPIYFVNGAIETQDTAQNAFTAYAPTTKGASASNWNAKLEWKSGEAGPTLTLNGLKVDDYNDEKGYWKYRGEGFDLADHAQTTGITAPTTAPLTIVLTGEDSLIETKFGISFNNELTIKSEGTAKLEINAMSAGINGAKGCKVTIDANLDVDVASYYSSTMMVLGVTEADIIINGGNINLTGTTSLVGMKTATSGNIYINGGNVYAKGGYRGATVPTADYHLYVNGGSLTLIGSYSAIYKGSAKGVVTIPDGADVEIMTGTKVDGTNATVKDAIASAIYVKVTYKSAPAPTPTETTAPSTEAPTAAPSTEAPTVAPTAAPSTEAPTVAPTEAPTTAPTTAPTGGALEQKVVIRIAYSTLTLSKYDTPIYTKNVSKDAKDTAGNAFTAWEQTTTGADESNYNLKFVWNTGDEAPTLILRGFKFVGRNSASGKLIGKVVDGEYTTTGVEAYPLTFQQAVPVKIVIAEDSLIEGAFGITLKGATTIVSENNAKLVMNCRTSCIGTGENAGATLTIENANLDLTTNSYYNTAYSAGVIQTNKADIIINGGTIVCKNNADKSVAGIIARNSGNVVINGGDVTAHGIAGTSTTNGSITAPAGKVIVNGGKVKATAAAALPMYALKGIEINGGEIDIVSPYYGMNVGNADTPADIVINGGKVKIVSEKGAFYKMPILGAGVDGFAGTSEDDADYYDETKYKAKWLELSYTAPSAPTTPSNPTGGTTAPSTPGATTPSTPGATQPSTPSNPSNPETGDSSATMFIVMLLIGMFGIVATIAFSKKRAV